MSRLGKRPKLKLFGLISLAFLATVYLLNASWLATPPNPEVQLIAHRGIHQTFHRENLTNETCTAARIDEPRHPFLENTLQSIEAAFSAGADVVEVDVHPTTDGAFAVFHDWTLDCRTDGTGRVRDKSLAELKKLDIGYGYTADGGATYPFRGKGIAAMPSLRELLDRFEGRKLLIDFKGGGQSEGKLLANILQENPARRDTVWAIYGGRAAVEESKIRLQGMKGFTQRAMRECLLRYAAIGWAGYVPQACRNTYLPIPINLAPLVWGWPDRFLARMNSVDTTVILFGPHEWGTTGSTGIDTVELTNEIPENFNGYVWTNRIELLGPALDRSR